MKNYLVATIKKWNLDAYHRNVSRLPGRWHLIHEADALTPEFLETLSPRYIFFPHWSWIVADKIIGNWECVCFHMTDVPYGRGGSPLQNLIVRGHKETKVSALRMVDELDAGPVYLKHPLSLEGRAQDIFERFADLAYDMIGEIVTREPEPVAQDGEATVFARRTPDQSALPAGVDMQCLYDHIRMLDADGYPPAFLENGAYRFEFCNARYDAGSGRLETEVTIKSRPDPTRPGQRRKARDAK